MHVFEHACACGCVNVYAECLCAFAFGSDSMWDLCAFELGGVYLCMHLCLHVLVVFCEPSCGQYSCVYASVCISMYVSIMFDLDLCVCVCVYIYIYIMCAYMNVHTYIQTS
jgi:hypothetical protein